MIGIVEINQSTTDLNFLPRINDAYFPAVDVPFMHASVLPFPTRYHFYRVTQSITQINIMVKLHISMPKWTRIDDSSYRLNFNLGRKNEIHHYS
jgi:hypothetical protein